MSLVIWGVIALIMSSLQCVRPRHGVPFVCLKALCYESVNEVLHAVSVYIGPRYTDTRLYFETMTNNAFQSDIAKFEASSENHTKLGKTKRYILKSNYSTKGVCHIKCLRKRNRSFPIFFTAVCELRHSWWTVVKIWPNYIICWQ